MKVKKIVDYKMLEMKMKMKIQMKTPIQMMLLLMLVQYRILKMLNKRRRIRGVKKGLRIKRHFKSNLTNFIIPF